MNRSPDRLFDLLPVVHRQRDAAQGHPLKALLQVIAEQAGVIEDDIDRLYENWFIETCDDWVVPYLGELIGYRAVHEAGQPVDLADARGQRLARILVPRREVANTLRYRRRKGTLALLELLARDVAGWPARAVEFHRRLAWTQPLNHQRLQRGRSADLRDGDALARVDGPFDGLAHSVDVRRPGSRRTPGRYNVPSVGLFVWRLKAFPVTRTPACCLEAVGAHCYTFSVLGNDAPLFTRPAAAPSEAHAAGPLDVPDPLRRRAVARDPGGYYGPGRSFAIWADGWAGHTAAAPLPADALIVADLSDWTYQVPRDRVAVDPVLGRIAFPLRQLPRKGVWVGYHYGFSDDLGGGEYRREPSQPGNATLYRVGQDAEFARIGDALLRWDEERPDEAVIEIVDGGVYVEQIDIDLAQGQRLQLRAADRTRPVLRLMDWQTARPDALHVRGAEEGGGRFVLDGLLVTGRGVHCHGPLEEVRIRHCTLVPGWAIGPDCKPQRPAEPSLELTDTQARVRIERSILGSIQVSQNEVHADPVPIRISDSILDATGRSREAVGAPGWPLAHAVLIFERCTVFGAVQAHAIELAENSLFTGHVHVARRQLGCMRFCHVPPGSRTPRRYRCQPDLVDAAVREAIPNEEIGPDAHACLVIRSEDDEAVPVLPEDVCAAPAGKANLELTIEISNAAPTLGDRVTVAISVQNHGPRDAMGLEVALSATPDGHLGDPGGVTCSQGEIVETGSDSGLLWKAGDLQAGRRATVTIHDVPATSATAPEAVIVAARLVAHAFAGDGRAFVDRRIQRERQRVVPRFNSIRYGSPTYAQLALHCAAEIARGADDESEMGAFHDLFQPQRAANLAARLDEFVPAGMNPGIIYVS